MEFRGEKSDGLKVMKPKKRIICFNCVQTMYMKLPISFSLIQPKSSSFQIFFRNLLKEIINQESVVSNCGYFLRTCIIYTYI